MAAVLNKFLTFASPASTAESFLESANGPTPDDIQDALVLPPNKKQSEKEDQGLETLNRTMDWFRQKGVQRGNPESIESDFNSSQLKKVMSLVEIGNEAPSGLLARRLKKKMTLSM